jgi:outer membrane protein
MRRRALQVLALAAACTTARAQEPPVVPPSSVPPSAVPPSAVPQVASVDAPLAAQLTFDEAVRKALERNPTVAQAAQAIERARGLLAQARAVFRPAVSGFAGTTVLDDARGFDGNVTQPRTQTTLNATASFAFFAPARWAARNQANDQVRVATLSAEDVRRQVAVTAAQSYLAVVLAHRQQDIALRNRDTARALEEYARLRLEAGQGSRLNHVRSTQEVAITEGAVEATALALRQTQEALGVAVFAEGPVDANGDPLLLLAGPPADEAWLDQRPDVRLLTAELQAAERVVRDSWKDWLPTGVASFTPQHVTPKGFFEPASTWRAVFGVQVPIYDGTLGGLKRTRIADREVARLRLEAVRNQARSEMRAAQAGVSRLERVAASLRVAAENAAEALRITEIAYRAGATTNIEVVQAQQTARNAELAAAQAEDRFRQVQLDLLVALGRFPG